MSTMFEISTNLSLFHNDSTDDDNFEVNDLADLTPQCGRKGDAFKLFLSWAYYGLSGLSAQIKNAFERADQLMTILESDSDFTLVSRRPLPCLQVCPILCNVLTTGVLLLYPDRHGGRGRD